MHQGLSCVPDDVTNWLFGVYSKQVLKDTEEWDLLRSVGHLEYVNFVFLML